MYIAYIMRSCCPLQRGYLGSLPGLGKACEIELISAEICKLSWERDGHIRVSVRKGELREITLCHLLIPLASKPNF